MNNSGMTPQEKLNTFTAKQRKEFESLLRYASRIADLPRNFDYRAKLMFAIIDEITAMIAPLAYCKKDCDFCCHQAVTVSTWEAKRIAKVAHYKMIQFTGNDVFDNESTKRQQYIEKFSGKKCPFLKDRQCSIYNVRPASCRLHLSLANDALPCDIVNNSGAHVPYFNFGALKIEVANLFLDGNCKFGDIREFFEEEKI